jgi:hypothetical protein
MNLRPVVLLLIAALGAAVGLTAPASALEVPTLPSVTAPTVEPPPLPAPTLPAPTVPAPTVPAPTVPAPTPTPTVPAPTPTVTTPPSLPAPTPTLPTTTSSPSAPAPAPSAPAPVSQVTQTVQSTATTAAGTATGATGTAAGTAGTTAGTAGTTAGTAGGAATGSVEPRTGAAAGGVPGGFFAGGGSGASAAPMPVSRVPIVASASSGNAPSAKRPKRPRKIILGFVSYERGRLALPVVQISPFCRRVGTIAVNARRGVNLLRFNGRLGRRWLLDGTYVLVTPTMRIRFAVVAGRPTRKKTRLQPSTCREGVEVLLSGGSVPLGSASAGFAEGETVPVTEAGGITDVGVPKVLPSGQSGPSKVLGTTIDSVKTVVTGLHPAFYVLLAMAIAALAAATLPASAVPSPSLGATLARRRAELTLAGTMALVTVIVAYLLTVGT